MKLVCLDTNVLIWGIKGLATSGQEDMISRAKIFIDTLNDDKELTILIPSIVIAEYLLPIPHQEHANIINVFNSSFIIAPFDAFAASKFSIIWNTHKPSQEVEKLVKNGFTKTELRADSMIVATAVARKAECIYSHDNGVKNFAKGFIDVREIPFIPKQQDAFESDSNTTDWGKPPKKMNES